MRIKKPLAQSARHDKLLTMSLHDRDYMREGPSFERPSTGISALHILLALNTVVFVTQHIFGHWGLMWGPRFYPYGGVSVDALSRGQVWTLFSYMFVHGSLGHFVLNMLMLWFAGRGLQQLAGSFHLTMVYLFAGIAGAAAEMAVNGWVYGNTVSPLIGASASAFGILVALAAIIPEEEITALIYFVIPVRMRLWTMAKAMCLVQLVLGLLYVTFDFMPEDMKIAYFAHLGGAAAGWAYARHMGYGGRPMAFDRAEGSRPFIPQRQPHMARARSTREAPLDSAPDSSAPASTRPRSTDPVMNLIEDVINPLLDKMNLHGKDSLTEDERRMLHHASAEVNRHRRR